MFDLTSYIPEIDINIDADRGNSGLNVVVEVKEKDNRESVLCCVYIHIYLTR